MKIYQPRKIKRLSLEKEFEFRQRRLSCGCSDCGSLNMKAKKLQGIVIGEERRTQVAPKKAISIKVSLLGAPPPTNSIKSMKSITTKISSQDLLSQKASYQLGDNESPNKN